MKTWFCIVFGAGTPDYIVSAENEARAWELIKGKLDRITYSLCKETSGLIEVPIHADEERIIDLTEEIAP